MPAVERDWRDAGFVVEEWGFERDNSAIRDAIRRRGWDDVTASMLRFRPDKLVLPRFAGSSLFCEVKTDGGETDNYALEFRCWLACMEWSKVAPVIFSFYVVTTGVHACCFASDLKVTHVRVFPGHGDADAAAANARALGLKVYEQRFRGGSGTPFTTISKGSTYFRPFDGFVKELTRAA